MPSCCVKGCGNYWKKKGKNANIQYHVFPRDYSRASEWLQSIKQNFVYNTLQTKRVCSEHFSDKCYTRDLRNELLGLPKRKFLSPDAVPDINIPTGDIAENSDHSDLQNDNSTSITLPNKSDDLNTNTSNNSSKTSEEIGADNDETSSNDERECHEGFLRSKKGIMPQCKDRLRYRWLGFHLDLTTSARLRSAAPPARRPRSKRRRPRKQDDHRVEAFNLLFALGLVPTKSRMDDPQGLLLNRMHVMDGDCPKSEVIAEKAPELDLSTPRSVAITSDSNGVTSTSTIDDTTAALTVTNTANCNNNNSINSTKDKDVINNFSTATTKHVLQYLSTSNIDKKDNTANLLQVNDIISDSVNDSIDEKKRKKNDCGFNNVDKKINVADKMIKVVDSSEICDDGKIDDHDNKGDDKLGLNSNDDSLNNSCKLVNGNKDENSANESSDGSDDNHDRTDDSANVNNVGDDSSTGVKSGVIDEDVEEDTPVDMLVEEEEEEVDEEIEDEEDIEIDKNIEDDILEENDTEDPEQKLETVKIDTKTNIVSPKQEQIDDDDKPLTEDVPLDMYISRKESTPMDVVNETSTITSLNSSSVGDIPSSIKSEHKDDSCVTSNSNTIANNSGACSEEDRTSVTSSQSRKRTIGERDRGEGETGGGEVDNEVEGENEGEGSSSESEGGTKRQRVNVEAEDERERLVREYVERCTQSVEEMSRNADKLQREIGALGELARAKELEWNSILRLRKLKEEMLERLLRRRRQAMMLADNGLTQDWATDYTKPKMNKQLPNNHSHNQLMMVPVVSSSPGNLPPTVASSISSRPILSSPDTTRTIARMQQRPILPKPLISHSHPNLNSNLNSSSLLDQQNTIIGEGRQGPILDVKSIIADYRSRNPDNVPRRGRRMKSPMVSSTRISGSPALMSMANMALCSGAHIRNTSQECTSVQDNSRPSSTDSTRSVHQTELPAPGLSFKDVLVQFAKMNQPPPPTPIPPIKQQPPPPPPYPEVTLHPVPAPQSPPPTHSSLLHGILTKTTAAPSSTTTANHRPTTFSPTLARLLTAPERERTAPMMSSQFRPPTSRVSISDLLTSSKKTRNEITITPVSSQSPVKSKDEVVLLDDDEETDSTDRLVIDEGSDRDREGNNSGDVNSDDVPECQGCHQRAALFVCAGCGNQWYCSRECQVTAWEEHCETCSG